MSKKIRPLADRVMVKKVEAEDSKSEGGLYIPASAREEGGAAMGVVLAVGDGIYNEKGEFIRPLNIKEGDTVVFGKYAGIEFVLSRQSFLLMQEIDILGIVEG